MSEPAAAPPRGEDPTWGEIVWDQFLKRRLARAALWGVAGLFVLAIGAPLFASNQPFVHRDAAGWQSPWLMSLFDRNFFSGAVDILFNALLLPGVLLAIGPWWVWRRTRDLPRRQRTPRRRRAFLVTLGLWAVIVAGIFASPVSRPFTDWAYEKEVATARGEEVVQVLPPLPWSHRDGVLSEKLADPSLKHPLGTDNQGRDTLTRLVYGTRISLTIGVFAVTLYCSLGILLGALAGYFGGRVDLSIQGLIEVIMCIPSMFLVLAAAAFIEDRSVFHIMAIIAAVSWTGPARLVRAEFLRLKNVDFVAAAEAAGFRKRAIIFQEILPNALGPVLVTATFGVASAILVESTMSFLGLGDISAPSWGQMLSSGRSEDDWLLILAPGFAIFVTVSLLNLVGEGVRDALDPKLRR